MNSTLPSERRTLLEWAIRHRAPNAVAADAPVFGNQDDGDREVSAALTSADLAGRARSLAGDAVRCGRGRTHRATTTARCSRRTSRRSLPTSRARSRAAG